MKQSIVVFGLVTALASCGHAENAAAQEAAQPRRRPPEQELAVNAETMRGGKTRVTLRSVATAEAIITLVGQLNYDPSRLSLKGCEIGREIGAGTASGKALHVAEPTLGIVRAVIEGGLRSLPPNVELMICTFAAVPGAPSGPVTVHAEGSVADLSFVDRLFVLNAIVGRTRRRRSM